MSDQKARPAQAFSMTASRQAASKAKEALSQLKQNELRNLEDRTAIEYQEQHGRRTLRYFPNETGSPVLTLVRKPDGTIAANERGAEVQYIEMIPQADKGGHHYLQRFSNVLDIRRTISQRLLHELAGTLDPATLEAILQQAKETQGIWAATRETAEEICWEASMKFTDGTEHENITILEAMLLGQSITKERLIDPKYEHEQRMVPKGMGVSLLSIGEYNQWVLRTQNGEQGKKEITRNWTPLLYEKGDGWQEIRLMVNQEGLEQASIRHEEQDGTIVYTQDGEVMDTSLLLKDLEFNRSLERSIAVESMISLIDQNIAETAKIVINSGLTHEERDKARRLIAGNFNKSVVPERYKSIPDGMNYEKTMKAVEKTAKTIMRKKMLNPDTETLAMEIFGLPREKIATNVYNHTALNERIFRELNRTNPGPLRFYAKNLRRRMNWTAEYLPDPCSEAGDTAPYGLAHMGEVISEVKSELGMNAAEWKEFCKCSPEWFNAPPLHPGDADRIRLICRALAEANRPGATPECRQTLAAMSHYVTTMAETEEQWQAWILILNRWLDPMEKTAKNEQQLRAVADAMSQRLERGETWGPGTWQEMHRRAVAWNIRRATEMRQRKYAGMNANWSSMLDKVEAGKITFDAVTNARELVSLGEMMNNCIGNYIERCANGHSRIFKAANPDGKLLAAVQLSRTNGRWNLIQIEGPRRGQPGADVKRAAKELAEAYQEKYQEFLDAVAESPEQ